jgi:hypothetical protein
MLLLVNKQKMKKCTQHSHSHGRNTRIASLLFVDLHLVVCEVVGDDKLAALVLVAVRHLRRKKTKENDKCDNERKTETRSERVRSSAEECVESLMTATRSRNTQKTKHIRKSIAPAWRRSASSSCRTRSACPSPSWAAWAPGCRPSRASPPRCRSCSPTERKII